MTWHCLTILKSNFSKFCTKIAQTQIYTCDNIENNLYNHGCLDSISAQSRSGVICIFSLKNPSYPEYLCWAQAGIMCIDFHPQVSCI